MSEKNVDNGEEGRVKMAVEYRRWPQRALRSVTLIPAYQRAPLRRASSLRLSHDQLVWLTATRGICLVSLVVHGR